jgi:excisionase family DNA binding protein
MLYSTKEVAENLSVPEIDIRRLIAKRKLKATQIGESKFSVLDSELDAFVASGAPDLKPPKPIDGDWRLIYPHYADQFVSAIGLAIAPQQLTDEAVKAQYLKDEQPTFDVTLTASPEVLAVCKQPPPETLGSHFTKANDPNLRYADWRSLYMGAKLREQVRIVIRDFPSNERMGGSPLAGLYSSPDKYEQIKTATIAAIQRTKILFLRAYTIQCKMDLKPWLPEQGDALAPQTVWIKGCYLLPHSSLATPEEFNNIADLTF